MNRGPNQIKNTSVKKKPAHHHALGFFNFLPQIFNLFKFSSAHPAEKLPKNTSLLNSMPSEILSLIFSFLAEKDRLHLRAVCLRFKELIDTYLPNSLINSPEAHATLAMPAPNLSAIHLENLWQQQQTEIDFLVAHKNEILQKINGKKDKIKQAFEFFTLTEKSVKNLSLRHYAINHINSDLILANFSVTKSELNLISCYLTRLPYSTLVKVSDYITCLNLTGNNITQFTAVSWPKLEYLTISQNKLQALPPLKKFRALKKFDASYNQLTELPSHIEGSVSLQELNLSNNKIETLPTTISALPFLKKLFVAGNYLTTLPKLQQGHYYYGNAVSYPLSNEGVIARQKKRALPTEAEQPAAKKPRI